jgi:hypothetical protein
LNSQGGLQQRPFFVLSPCCIGSNGSGFSCEPRRLRGRSKPISSSPECTTFRTKNAVVRRLQALVIERLACEIWIDQRSLSATELGSRISLARSASSGGHIATHGRTRQSRKRRREDPILKAADRTSLRAGDDCDGLFIGRPSCRLPRPTKAPSPTTRKSNVARELYNGSTISRVGLCRGSRRA